MNVVSVKKGTIMTVPVMTVTVTTVPVMIMTVVTVSLTAIRKVINKQMLLQFIPITIITCEMHLKSA